MPSSSAAPLFVFMLHPRAPATQRDRICGDDVVGRDPTSVIFAPLSIMNGVGNVAAVRLVPDGRIRMEVTVW